MQKKKQVARNKWLDILIFVLFLNVFFFHNFGVVALALFMAGWYLLASSIFGKFEHWLNVLFGTNLIIMFFVNSPEKIGLLVGLSILMIMTGVYRGLKSGSISGLLELGLSPFLVGFEYVHSGFTLMASALRGTLRDVLQLGHVQKERSPWIKSILVGVIVGLPLVAWLVMTLSKADPVFSVFIKGVVSDKLLTELPARLALSLLAMIFLTPVLIMKWRGYVSPLSWLSKVNFGREMSVIVAMIVLILGIFLVVQWPYVFVSVAKEVDLSQYGVATYSEYVQKGFWDLLKVATMVFGVSWITLILSKNKNDSARKVMMTFQAVLGAEFVLFIGSIFRRVWLYQSYHGLTLARLYGLALLIWLVGMTISMGLRYFYQGVRMVRGEIGWSIVVLYSVVLLNMEARIVANPPTVNNNIDYVYLSKLSGDGREGWKQAYVWGQEVLDQDRPRGLQIEKDDRRNIYYAGLISQKLAINYHKLVMRYGSDDEVREYMRAIIEEIRLNGEPLQDSEKYLSALDKDNWQEKVDVSLAYDLNNSKNYYDRSRLYYNVSNRSESERLLGLDKVLDWQWSQKRLYEWMKKEISLESLLKMQRDEASLISRIGNQPDQERDFEVDVSFENPFLR